MMKQIATILFVVGCMLSAIADNVPPELKKLKKIRAEKIKEIDDAYVKALEKLKLNYMKRGDLDGANAVNDELMLFSEPQQAQTDSQEQIVGSNPNDSINKISDDWETCKVSEGILVAVPLKTELTYDQAVQEAKLYGATLYCPQKYRDAKRMLNLMPDVSASSEGHNHAWLGSVECRLKDGTLEVYTSDGEEFDCKKIFGIPVEAHGALEKRPAGTESNIKIIAKYKSLSARKPGEMANYLIILIPDDN